MSTEAGERVASDRIFTLDEIHEFAVTVTEQHERRAAIVTTDAGRTLLAASRTVTAKDRSVITVSDGDVLAAIVAIEAEAGSLDAAWAACEAALPDGWIGPSLVTETTATGPLVFGWRAFVWEYAKPHGKPPTATGSTPAEALNRLAQLLTEQAAKR